MWLSVIRSGFLCVGLVSFGVFRLDSFDCTTFENHSCFVVSAWVVYRSFGRVGVREWSRFRIASLSSFAAPSFLWGEGGSYLRSP